MKKLLFGLISGISLGLLFAPKKGKELRKELGKSNQKAKDFLNEFQIAANDANQEVQKFTKSKEFQDAVTKGKKHLEMLLQETENISEKGKIELKSIIKAIDTKKGSLLDAIQSFLEEGAIEDVSQNKTSTQKKKKES